MDDAYAPASATRRAVARLVGLFNLAGAVILGFLMLITNGLRCDDNCSIAPGWRNDPNAWQWDATLNAALVILASAILLNAALWMARRWVWKWAAVVIQIGALVILAVLALTASPDVHDGWNWIALLFLFFGVTGAGSALLADPGAHVLS